MDYINQYKSVTENKGLYEQIKNLDNQLLQSVISPEVCYKMKKKYKRQIENILIHNYETKQLNNDTLLIYFLQFILFQSNWILDNLDQKHDKKFESFSAFQFKIYGECLKISKEIIEILNDKWGPDVHVHSHYHDYINRAKRKEWYFKHLYDEEEYWHNQRWWMSM